MFRLDSTWWHNPVNPLLLNGPEKRGGYTGIEWTDATWNPVSGCTKVTRGCDHCYAERLAERFRGVKGHPFEHGFDLTLRPHKLREPLTWRSPRRVFVNSMSDLFHKEVPKDFIDRVFDTMEEAHWHVFQVLTKRSSLLRRYVNERYATSAAPRHIWFGVSVEDRQALVRLRHLQQARASVRFISFEPLLEDLDELDLNDIHCTAAGPRWGVVECGRAQELKTLKALAKSGVSTTRVAKTLGRTAAAVQQKAMRSGISFRAPRRKK